MAKKPFAASSLLAGLALGLCGASFFGFIPVFAVPLLHMGYPVETIAFYRFALAALILSPALALKKEPCSTRGALGAMAIAIFYFLDVIFFFHGLKYLAGGIVATLEFLCPVFTLAIMILFFHQKFHWQTGLAILLAIGGVAMLSLTADSSMASAQTGKGVILSLLAALCNALYYAGFKCLGKNSPGPLKTTFYVMLSCSLCCLGNAFISDAFQSIIHLLHPSNSKHWN